MPLTHQALLKESRSKALCVMCSHTPSETHILLLSLVTGQLQINISIISSLSYLRSICSSGNACFADCCLWWKCLCLMSTQYSLKAECSECGVGRGPYTDCSSSSMKRCRLMWFKPWLGCLTKEDSWNQLKKRSKCGLHFLWKSFSLKHEVCERCLTFLPC